MSNFVEIQSGDVNPSINGIDNNTLDLYFKIHEKVNARNEKTGRSYKNNIVIHFDDIKELHNKTMQCISSLNAEKSNSNIQIAVSHSEGETDVFKSFEKFEEHNISSPNPTLDINMVYVFTLYNTETKSFENYKITNEISSRIAELKQIEEETPPFISKMFISNILTTTAEIEIEYSDYVKARHFTAMFDEWVKGREESDTKKWIRWLKSYSHIIPRIGLIIVWILLAISTIKAIDSNIIQANLSVKFIIAYTSFFIIITNIAAISLKNIEMSIDRYLEISYIEINKGDSKLIKEFSNKNKSSFVMAIIGAVCTIGVGVITRFTYDIIKSLIV